VRYEGLDRKEKKKKHEEEKKKKILLVQFFQLSSMCKRWHLDFERCRHRSNKATGKERKKRQKEREKEEEEKKSKRDFAEHKKPSPSLQ